MRVDGSARCLRARRAAQGTGRNPGRRVADAAVGEPAAGMPRIAGRGTEETAPAGEATPPYRRQRGPAANSLSKNPRDADDASAGVDIEVEQLAAAEVHRAHGAARDDHPARVALWLEFQYLSDGRTVRVDLQNGGAYRLGWGLVRRLQTALQFIKVEHLQSLGGSNSNPRDRPYVSII